MIPKMVMPLKGKGANSEVEKFAGKRLIHAAPKLFLNCHGKPGQETQQHTLELINGLVSLAYHYQGMPDVAQEAMGALSEVYACNTCNSQ